jgi:alpha-D-xyloside xylohydrolase
MEDARTKQGSGVSLTAAGFAGAAHAEPIATLDRDGAWVSLEAYGPNVVHVTIAADKAEALKGPGPGILPANADNSAFQFRPGASGDSLFRRR